MIRKNRIYILVLAGIIIITGLLYGTSLRGDFLSYDDTDNIVNDVLIRNLSLESLPAFFKTTNLYMYSPITFISYAMDYKFAEMNAFYFRLTNLLLHLVNVLLVFFLAMRLLKKANLSLIMAALFGLNPLDVDTVAWVSARSNLLATLFFLLVLIFYLNYVRKNNFLFYFLSIVTFLFSLFSKSAGVMLPFTLLLLDYLFSRKINSRLIFEKIPFFVIALLFGLLAIYFRTDTGTTQTTIQYSLIDRLFMVCFSIVTYIIHSLVPYHLSEIYGYPLKSGGTLPLSYYSSSVLILGIIFLIFRLKTLKKEIIFGLLFFFVNIIITQIVMLEDSFRANRYAYLPYIGLFCLFIQVGDKALQNYQNIKKYVFIPILILLFVFGNMTFQRSLVWENTLSLFNHAIAQSPDAAFAYNNRGIARYSQGDLDGAFTDYNQAIVLNPKYSGAYYNRGIVFNNAGQFENAMEDYSKAICLNPNFASSYVARGIIEMDITKDYPSALKDYAKALEINPSSAQAYYNRGLLRLRLNDLDNACLDFSNVKKLGYDKADDLIERFCR